MTIELKRGVSLGSCELLVKIGQGGMASVWVAREHGAEGGPRLVAVKTMLPQLSDDPKFRAMFLDEVGLVRSIHHENVVNLHSTAEAGGLLYMVMEWVEGDSLRAVIQEAKKRRPIPPEIAVRVIADAAAGLHAAHELTGWDGELRGVVHCDVSPHNILCGIDGNVKLVDFGVANAMSQVDDTDEVKGKFGYMSPEQARGDPIDRRSDVFSLGIVLFELTTGYRLFVGRDNAHTLDLVKWGRLPKPTDVIPDYPRALEPIVLKALERDLDLRFQTADELRDALERYLVDERILVTRAGVASLVKRVLGERIERIRIAVRAALEDLDGSAPSAGVLPAEPVLSPREIEELSLVAPEEVSLSRIEATPVEEAVVQMPVGDADHVETATAPAYAFGSVSLRPRSEPPPGTGSYEAARPARSPVLAFTVVAILALLVVVLFFLRSRDEPPVASSHSPGASPVVPANAAPAARRGNDEGLDVESLPVGEGARAISVDSLPMQESAADHERSRASERERDPSVDAPRRTDDGKNPSTIRLKEEPEKPPEKPPVKAEGVNRSALLAALGSAAGSASGCRKANGPSGSGRATVTFSPDGSVTGVSLSGPFAGTPVGQCVTASFRAAKIPPFSGSPVTMGRSFAVPQ